MGGGRYESESKAWEYGPFIVTVSRIITFQPHARDAKFV